MGEGADFKAQRCICGVSPTLIESAGIDFLLAWRRPECRKGCSENILERKCARETHVDSPRTEFNDGAYFEEPYSQRCSLGVLELRARQSVSS